LVNGLANAQTADLPCSQIEASPDFSGAMAYLKKDYNSPPVFGQFSIGRVTSVILDTSADPHRAAITKAGVVIAKIPLAKQIPLANGLYDFYRPEVPINPDIAELKARAATKIPPRFIIFDVGSPGMKQMAEELAKTFRAHLAIPQPYSYSFFGSVMQRC
jgi:hypothetical protein